LSTSTGALWWYFVMVTLALVVILTAFGAAMVIYQRRFVQMHRTYAKNLLAAHEEERAWVAREVHDDALQRVAMLVHELDDWSASAGAEREKVAALREEIEDLGVMLRRVAHRLHPAILDHAGLVPALHALAVDVSRATGLHVDVTEAASDGSYVDRDHSLILYRIAQEALRNVAKHAGVSNCRLHITVLRSAVELTVTDNGKGFVTDDTARGRGLGLISMGERARLADGRLEIWSQPGSGTTVRATIPQRAGEPRPATPTPPEVPRIPTASGVSG
jgi:signal transduction histidine kinase